MRNCGCCCAAAKITRKNFLKNVTFQFFMYLIYIRGKIVGGSVTGGQEKL